PLEPGGDPLVEIERDPWGGEYRIQPAGTTTAGGYQRFLIVSNGPDGLAGTGDDIGYPRTKPAR
ncbi:MAG: hypothetical protein ACE5JG_09050, partial [Planctomycetota bacterium]